jgi:hypothetical protein
MRASMSSLLRPGLPDLESLLETGTGRTGGGSDTENEWLASSVLFDAGSCGRSFANDQDRGILLFCAIPMHAFG